MSKHSYTGIIDRIEKNPQGRTCGYINNIKNKNGEISTTSEIYFTIDKFKNTGCEPKKGDEVSFICFNIKQIKPQPKDIVLLYNLQGQRKIQQRDGLAPYTFVGINKNKLDNSTLFDINDSDDDYFSGSIKYTMTTLSPMIVGQHYYNAEDSSGQPSQFKEWGLHQLNPKKSILEPLRTSLGESKPVVIPGSTLKGLLRQSISTLLNSPMERAQEQHYSYRPNIQASSKDDRLITRRAMVTHADKNNNKIMIKFFDNSGKDSSETFIKNSVTQKNSQICNKDIPTDTVLSKGTIIDGLKDPNEKSASATSSWALKDNYLVLTYCNGIDGRGALRTLFKNHQSNTNDSSENTESDPDLYSHVIIKKRYLPDGLGHRIPSAIVERYTATQEQLSNNEIGHISSRHPHLSTSNVNTLKTIKEYIGIAKSCVFNPGQFIYVEWDTTTKEVVSFGHHYYYRWAYGDTIRQVYNPDTKILEPRPELNPICGEGVTENSGKLSGARLFFGYTVESKDGANQGTQAATHGIGDGDYSRMAGRVSINSAIENIYQSNSKKHNIRKKTIKQRFVMRAAGSAQLTETQRLNIPLKVLGMPRPSAVEYYLDQSQLGNRDYNEKTVTYGDLPNTKPIDIRHQATKSNKESNSVLNGRKYYRHQKRQARNQNFEERDDDAISSNLSTLARFISEENSEFRFSLRFKRLRLWELGAILVSLEPDLLLQENIKLPTEIKSIILNKKQENQPARAAHYAHKIGYGRPLGLGSVYFNQQKLKINLFSENNFQNNSSTTGLKAEAIIAFLNLLEERRLCLNLVSWLQVLDYTPLENVSYAPTHYTDIFEYHAKIRKNHAKTRREHNQKNNDGATEEYAARVKPYQK